MKCQVTRRDNGLGLFHDVRREFDDLFGKWLGEAGVVREGVMGPALNLAETDAAFEVSLDLPGIRPEEVDVELKDGALWITGERQVVHQESDEQRKWHRVESQYGKFRRAVRLGEDVDPAQVSAEYRDGVLHVHVPKRESAQPRKIEIKHVSERQN